VKPDPESTLRPLHAHAADVQALRAGAPAAAAVVRLAHAAETVLRRMLRDDPTAPVELRLQALSGDDLPTADLLAELRRRNRLPMELAAAFHELAAAADRLQASGGGATPRDAELAVTVAEGLDRHLRAGPADGPLRDPVTARADETMIPNPEDHDRAHPVPTPDRAARSYLPYVLMAAVTLLVAFGVFALVRGAGGGGGALAEAEAAYRSGDLPAAERGFRRAAQEDPEAPLPRYYLAQIYRQAGRRNDAAAQLSAGLQANPGDARLNTELGYLLIESGRYPQAVERLRRAVDADSTSARAWGGLVQALRRWGRVAEAERALTLAPPEVRALLSAPPEAAPPSAAPAGDTLADVP
jgi:TolA-binding protein